MIKLADPVQRHIHAVAVRDTIVPDDAADLKLGAVVSAKQLKRFQRAMLPGVDFVDADMIAELDDPAGRRVGRVAFNNALQHLWVDGRWTGSGPAPHRLPKDAVEIAAFISQQTHLVDDADGDKNRVKKLLGFKIAEHAHITDLLRAGGAGARMFIAASILSDAGAAFDKARRRTTATGRHQDEVDISAQRVEAALIGSARIATDILLTDPTALKGIHKIAAYLIKQVKAIRRARSKSNIARSMNIAVAAAAAIHLWLTRGTLHDVPSAADSTPGGLSKQLQATSATLTAQVDAMIAEVASVDTTELYVMLMARRLSTAVTRYKWLAAAHPVFRLNYGFIGGHALFAEVERLVLIVATMSLRQQFAGGTLDSKTIKPPMASPAATQATIACQTSAGRYLDLGVYHRAVVTEFIKHQAHWLATTVPAYTHHAYALGTRFCDLSAAASDASTHNFIRQTEFDKPSQQGTRRQPLVLFYGLSIEDTVLLGLRQILYRLKVHGTGRDDWRVTFGRTAHDILKMTAPPIAKLFSMKYALYIKYADGKGVNNRATALANRFDYRDHDRPAGIGFDYALWFHRDRDVPFWDRLQKGAKLYGAFGSTFIPSVDPIEREPIPGRQGRPLTSSDAPPSHWQRIMAEAKAAFDAYQALYLKSRPTLLTARIMARMSEGYSAFASDPQFRNMYRF